MTPAREDAAVFFVVMTCAFGCIYTLKAIFKLGADIVKHWRILRNAPK